MAEVTRGERNIRWIESHCTIPEGKFVGQPFRLSKEQKAWLRLIYDTPTRRIIISMARKQGKTSFAACLLLLHLVGPEARPNSQLYSAAQSRDHSCGDGSGCWQQDAKRSKSRAPSRACARVLLSEMRSSAA